MGKRSPRSFRRILIVRLLLLGMPILLIGQYVALRNGRSGLLETARQGLTQSAVRQGHQLRNGIELLGANGHTLAQAIALQGDDPPAIAAQVDSFLAQMPSLDACIQVNRGLGDGVVVNTCPETLPATILPPLTQGKGQGQLLALQGVNDPNRAGIPLVANGVGGTGGVSPSVPPIQVTLGIPVYGPDQSLRYSLLLTAQLPGLESTPSHPLMEYALIIDDQQRVRVHPDPRWIGQPISRLPGADRLTALVERSQAGEPGFIHLFSFLPGTPEWLAGFTPLEMPLAPTSQAPWTVVAIAPLSQALQGLSDIRNTLILATGGLLVVQGVLILYFARRLSQPLERLATYAQGLQDFSDMDRVPQDFAVWEVDRLAKVMNRMLHRLEQRARELEHAWQEAQMANQLKSEFLANTSHELRTPLNGIIGCIRLVRDDCCDTEEEEKEFLTQADQAAIHLLDIINDILDLAKVEAGTLDLYVEPLDLAPVLQEVINLQGIMAQEKGVALTLDCGAAAFWVQGDRSKLKQVLLNVVGNAVKFTEAGSVAIAATLETQPETATPLPLSLPTPYPRVLITVRDTGIGIDPRQQGRLFQPFVTADGSRTRRYEGTGLGLAISRNLLILMEGSVGLHSEGLGQGSLVAIALPWLPGGAPMDSEASGQG